MTRISILFLFYSILLTSSVNGQISNDLSFFEIPDSLSKKRALVVGISSATVYTASLITLNEFWYKGFEKTSFQTFNDWGEWENMDKYGHAFSAYIETKLFFSASRWTGLSKKKSAIAAFAFSTLAQTSIEILDGHSARWGWSWHDVAFNTGGSLLFSLQEFAWQEQRLRMKLSYTPIDYDATPIVVDNQTSSILDRLFCSIQNR